jgi:hypothetical protein
MPGYAMTTRVQARNRVFPKKPGFFMGAGGVLDKGRLQDVVAR